MISITFPSSPIDFFPIKILTCLHSRSYWLIFIASQMSLKCYINILPKCLFFPDASLLSLESSSCLFFFFFLTLFILSFLSCSLVTLIFCQSSFGHWHSEISEWNVPLRVGFPLNISSPLPPTQRNGCIPLQGCGMLMSRRIFRLQEREG